MIIAIVIIIGHGCKKGNVRGSLPEGEGKETVVGDEED
jgi:hypothetical protein